MLYLTIGLPVREEAGMIMNKNQIQKLKAIIEKSRTRIMTKVPPLALMLMYVRFVAVPGMDRISTNGSCIFFDPGYLNKLKDGDLDFLLCHQIMHVLCEDIWRSEVYAYANYHYACDLKINAMLFREADFYTTQKIQHELPGIEKSPKEMSVGEILSNLVFDLDAFDSAVKKKYLIDSDVYWGKAPSAFGCTLILDREESEYINIFSPKDILPDPEQKAAWQERAELALATALKMGKRGNGKGEGENGIVELMQRIVKKLRTPSIDWRKVLNDFIHEEICDYSFAPPDRRFTETGFFLPDFNEKDFVTKEILFMVDTSGSVDDEALAAVYSEIKGALEQYDGKLVGKLGFFDFDATTPVSMNSVDDLLSIIPVGGGGTNFYSVFSVLEKDKPSCIIVFSDGRGNFPPEEIAEGIPVLWIISNNDIVAPFGKTIRLTSGHKV